MTAWSRRAGPLFEVRASSVHGLGVFAVRRIRRGTRIIDYTGECLTEDEVNRRYDDDAGERGHTFLFRVGDSLYIDADREGNDSRFINHSCDPNCEAVVEGNRISIRAIKTIPPPAELTYDYALELEEDPLASWEQLYACRCGALNCRGTILDPASIPAGLAPGQGDRAGER